MENIFPRMVAESSSGGQAASSLNAVATPRYAFMDVAKMVAALLVVFIHSQPFSGFCQTFFVDAVARMAVPFFFMASAFFFFKKPRAKRSVARYLRRMAVLYAVWFVVESPLTFLHVFIEPDASFQSKLLLFVRGFFLGSTFYGSWFLMALILTIPLLSALSRWPAWLSVCIGGVSYACVSLMSFHVAQLPLLFQTFAAACDGLFGHVEFSFFVAMLPCAIGRLFAENEERMVLLPTTVLFACTVLAFVVLLAEVFGQQQWCEANSVPFDRTDASLALPFCVSAVFCWVLRLRPFGDSGCLRLKSLHLKIDYGSLRVASTLFYFSHFIFVFILVVVNKHVFPVPPLLKLGIVVVCCTAFSYVVLRLEKMEGLQFLKLLH